MFTRNTLLCKIIFLVLYLASAASAPSNDEDLAGLHAVIKEDFTSGKPRVVVVSLWQYPQSAIGTDRITADDPGRIVAFGTPLVLQFGGLKPNAKYKLKLTYLSDSDDRIQQLYAGDVMLHDKVKLPKGEFLTTIVALPPETYRSSNVELKFTHSSGPNAVLSAIELWSTDKKLLPQIDITANGNLKGRIKGLLRDVNNDSRISSADIEILIEGTDLKATATTDANGNFSAVLPDRWRNHTGDSITITAEKGKAKQKIYLPAVEVFGPRLTPPPVWLTAAKRTKVNLNGTWKFNPQPPKDFSQAQKEMTEKWPDIEVPGEWVMQGFEVAKDTYAAYYQRFHIPADWAGKRVKLRCDAVYSDTKVWINGKKAGTHQGGFTPFELDITDIVNVGRINAVTMAVKNESLADVLASGTQYATHQLGGITRKIYLFAVDQLNIASLHVETTFDTDYRNAMLSILLEIANQSDKRIDNPQIKIALEEYYREKQVKLNSSVFKLPAIEPGQVLTHSIDVPVTKPEKWDCEHPNLYMLNCTLNAGGKDLETVQKRFGFRQIEIRGNEFFVNNRRIKLHGVNRHEAHPLRGRSLTPQLWRKDAELFRDANCNYIRTSHYPPAEEFIDACDQLGLFVEEEAPLCWVRHGANTTWRKNNPHNSAYLPTILRAILETIARDRSHPSVIVFSLANESGWGPNFEKALKLSTLADTTRPKSFHDQNWGQYNNYGSTTEIANYHYPGPTGPTRAADAKRPLLFGEYCHLNAYNRHELVTDPGLRDMWGIGFASMWQKMNAAKGILGGALWSGIDDTFFLPNGQTVGYGTWGPIDGWRRQKPEYWHMKKVYSPIQMLSKQIPADDNQQIRLEIQNRHDFTNVNELRIEWAIGNKKGTAAADIPPGEKGRIVIPARAKSLHGKKLSVKFFSPRGFMIDSFLLPVGKTSRIAPRPNTVPPGAITLHKTDEKITVHGNNFRYTFSAATGMITGAQIDRKTVLTAGPSLMLLPLNGSGGTQMTGSDRYEPDTAVCTGWQLSKIDCTKTADTVQIKIRGKYDQAEGTYTIKIDNMAKMTVDYEFTSTGKLNPRQLGIVFDLADVCDTLTWNRNAIWTTYPNDHIGRPAGSAKAFVGTKISASAGPWVAPHLPWSHDCNKMGTNDFRSTKQNIYWASLTASDESGLLIRSDGTQSTRAWVENDRIRLLVADYVNAGAERFFRSHAAVEDKPLNTADIIKGGIELELLRPNLKEHTK